MAVGPLLLGGVGGPVRDAGGIVDAEGRAVAGGRGSRPGPHLYMREADYVSPKCIVLRAAAYQRLWGFDPQVGPGGAGAWHALVLWWWHSLCNCAG